MEISAILLNEQEMADALAAYLGERLEKTVRVSAVKQITSKRGRTFAATVRVGEWEELDNEGSDSEPEEGGLTETVDGGESVGD